MTFFYAIFCIFAICIIEIETCLFGCDDASPADRIKDANTGCPLQCGRANGLKNATTLDKHYRMLGGEVDEEEDWPWMFRLETSDSTCNVVFSCTAALYSDRFVLTAAHCLFKNAYECKTHPSREKRTNNVPFSPEELKLIRKGKAYEVANIWTTPEFDENSRLETHFIGDLGLVELKESVNFEPLCWSNTFQRGVETTAHLVGYGAYGNDANGNLQADGQMRHAKMAITSVEKCRQTWGQRASICAGSENKGALLGDSGSPLMTTHLGLAFGHGVLSTYLPGNRRDVKPDIYVPVSRYCKFLADITGKACIDAYQIPVECQPVIEVGAKFRNDKADEEDGAQI